MRTFTNVCAQGDVYIRRIDSDRLPDGAVEVPAVDGQLIVTHSETSHHHTMNAEKVKMYALPDSILDCLLVVNEPTTLDHQRPYDTHESILFDRGIYRVRRQREYTPEGIRVVKD